MADRFDDFDRADQSGLGTPSDGGSDWQSTNANWLIDTNRAGVSAVGAAAVLETGSNAGRVEATWAVHGGSGARSIALVGRFVSDTAQCLFRVAYHSTNGNPTASLQAFNSGGFIQTIASVSLGSLPQAGDVLALEIDADHNWRAWINDEEIDFGSPVNDSRHEAGTKWGVNVAGLADQRIDDFSFVAAAVLGVSVDGDTLVTGEVDPRAGMIEQGDTPPQTTYTLVNPHSTDAMPIGTITVGSGLTIVTDPSNSSIPADDSVTLVVAPDTSTLGQIDSTITIPWGDSDDEFTVEYKAVIVRPIDLTGLIYVIGNSLTQDTYGTGLNDTTYGPLSAGVSGGQIRGGETPFGFVVDPWKAGDIIKPAAWPLALRNGAWKWVSVQRYTSDYPQMLPSMIQMIDMTPPTTGVINHTGWPPKAGFDLPSGASSYPHHIEQESRYLAGLIEAYPDRTIRSTYANRILYHVHTDAGAPSGLWDALFSDTLHMGTTLGRWFGNNIMRATIGQPLNRTLPGGDADYIDYLLSVLPLFHPVGAAGAARPVLSSPHLIGAL